VSGELYNLAGRSNSLSLARLTGPLALRRCCDLDLVWGRTRDSGFRIQDQSAIGATHALPIGATHKSSFGFMGGTFLNSDV
jgi:hypothetical protein